MKNTKKMVALLLALTLVLGCAIGGTIAYLMDTSKEIINTFTTSNVSITLEEAAPADNTAKMVPGSDIDKDPKVTVTTGSEKCYVFVKIVAGNGVVLANDRDVYDANVYITYAVDAGWKELDDGIYYRVVDTSEMGTALSILAGNKVHVLETVTKAMMESLTAETQPTLTFTAYAVQYENVADKETAWELAKNLPAKQ